LLTAEKSETPIDPPVVTPDTDDKPLDSRASGILVIEISQLSIYLPYSLRPIETQNVSNSVPSNPVHHAPHDINLESVASEPMAPSLSAVSNDETVAEDNSEDSVVVIKALSATDEADAVRRRWFREEMRQSPVKSLATFI
jgi:hypothetical protein